MILSLRPGPALLCVALARPFPLPLSARFTFDDAVFVAVAGIPGGYNLAELRVMGILQRIALCYLATALTTLASQRVVEVRVDRAEQATAEAWSYDKQVTETTTTETDRMAALLGGRELGSAVGVGMSTSTGEVEVAIGETVSLLHPPSTFSRCFNRDKNKGGCHQNDSLADG